jgi:hypothetical protein
MSAPSRSAIESKSLGPSAALLLFTLATLVTVTSSRLVFAQQVKLAATASAATIVAAAMDDDKDDEKDDDKDATKGEKGDDDDDDDAQKFLQPVRVGDLIGRAVIAPLESQDLLGHVSRLVKHDDDITIVMSYGGHLGFGSHLVCVPAAALALTGYALQAKDISTDDLGKLPMCDGSGDTPLDANTTIKMRLAKPAH